MNDDRLKRVEAMPTDAEMARALGGTCTTCDRRPCQCIEVLTDCRPIVAQGAVLGAAAHGLIVKLVDGRQQILPEVERGLYRAIRVRDDGLVLVPHVPKSLGTFKRFTVD